MIGIIAFAVIGALAGILSSIVVMIIGVCICVPVIYITGMKAKEVGETIEDERTAHISQRSAILSYGILVPALGVIGGCLVVLADDQGEWAYYVGITLCMVVLLFVAILITSYTIIDRGMK